MSHAKRIRKMRARLNKYKRCRFKTISNMDIFEKILKKYKGNIDHISYEYATRVHVKGVPT